MEDGFLNSGWSTAIFLLGGLGLAVGLLIAMVWVTSSINSVDWLAEEPHPGWPPAAPPQIPAPPQFQPPITPPQPQPQGFTDADRVRILGNLRTHESDEARLEDIRNGFSIDGLASDPDEIRECQAMAAVIKSTMTHDGFSFNVLPLRFSHTAMLMRIRQLLPDEISRQSKLILPVTYAVSSLTGVRVLRLRRLDGDQTRIAYCHLGPNIVDPYRFTLVRESTEWKVADFEAIDFGLAFSEVVAMNYLDLTVAPHLGLQIDTHFREAFRVQPLLARRLAIEQIRSEVIPKLPQPLRDYYYCYGSYVASALKDNAGSRFTWLDQIESTQRFGLAHKLRARAGLSDSPVSTPEEVIRHSEAYMDLFGTACSDVMISHAVALIRLGRVDESLTFWRQVFTMPPLNELGIGALAPQWRESEPNPVLDPLLDEFKLRGHVEAWIRAFPSPSLPNVPDEKSEESDNSDSRSPK